VSVTTDLLDGLASMIAAADIGVSYTPNGVYAASQTGVYMKILPAKPDRSVSLTAVVIGDNITLPTGRQMVQVRCRGAANRPLDVDDLADNIFDVLHGTTNLTFGVAHVTQMNRQISVPMGMDDSKRWERVDQYFLDVDSPPTTLRPKSGSW
jgi:hypothetical protein